MDEKKMEKKEESSFSVSREDWKAIKTMLDCFGGPAAVLKTLNSLQTELDSLKAALEVSRNLPVVEEEADHPPFNSEVTICEENLGDDPFGVSLTPRPSVTRNTFSSATIDEIAEELADRPLESKAPSPPPRKKDKEISAKTANFSGEDFAPRSNRFFAFFRENLKLILIGIGVVFFLLFSAWGIKKIASLDSGRGYKGYNDEEDVDEPSAVVDEVPVEVGPPAPKPVEVDNLDKQVVGALAIKNGTAPKSPPVEKFTTAVALDKKFVQPSDCGQLSGHDKEFDECLAFFEKALVVPKK
jgi:hypothetical protein